MCMRGRWRDFTRLVTEPLKGVHAFRYTYDA